MVTSNFFFPAFLWKSLFFSVPTVIHDLKGYCTSIPPKVQIHAWIIAHGRANTWDLIHRRRILFVCPPLGVLFGGIDHLFLHFPIALKLCRRLFKDAKLIWIVPANARLYFLKSTKLLGGGWRLKFYGMHVLMVFCLIWLERNKRILKLLWGGAAHLRCTFYVTKSDLGLWALVSSNFRLYHSFILADWKGAAC